MNNAPLARAKLPTWLWIVAAVGIVWNLFGIVQLVDFITQTQASLMMQGMSPAAATL